MKSAKVNSKAQESLTGSRVFRWYVGLTLEEKRLTLLALALKLLSELEVRRHRISMTDRSGQVCFSINLTRQGRGLAGKEKQNDGMVNTAKTGK